VGNSSGFERDQSLSRDHRNINSIDIAEGLHRAPCFEFCRLPRPEIGITRVWFKKSTHRPRAVPGSMQETGSYDTKTRRHKPLKLRGALRFALSSSLCASSPVSRRMPEVNVTQKETKS